MVDLSVRRVLEGLLAGPATVGILSTRFGMGVQESHEALAEAMDEGLVREVGPVGFELTELGARLARLEGEGGAVREAGVSARGLLRRDVGLRRFDR